MADRIDPRPGELLFDPACGTGGFLTCAIRHMRDRYVKKVEDEQDMQGALRAVEKKQLPTCSASPTCSCTGLRSPASSGAITRLRGPTSATPLPTVWTSSSPIRRSVVGKRTASSRNFPAHFQTRETADLFLALIIRLLKPGGRAAVVLPDGSLFGEGVKTRLKEHLLEECNLHTIVRLPNSVFKPYASIGTNLLFFEKGEPTKEIWFYEHRVPEGQKAYSMTRPIRLEHFKSCVEWWGGAERAGRVENESAWRVTIEEVKARGYNLDIKNPHTVADDYGDPEELLTRLDEAEKEADSLRDQLKAILRDALVGSPDVELIDAFMRTRETGEGTVLEVAVVEWHGPHEPGLRWEEYHSWVGTPTDGEVKAAQERALADPELFKQCGRCGERCNVGDMHDDTICQGCAERYLGVVH